MIVACIGLYGERVDQSLVGIKRLQPHVDRYVVIVDETVTEKQKQQLKDAGCEVYFYPWEDSMVKMRNQYLDKCQTDDWIAVHDPDERFNEQFCKDVHELCDKAERNDIQMLLINSHDTTIQADDSKDENVSDFFKNLIYRKIEGTHYEGVGVGKVHETLVTEDEARHTREFEDYFVIIPQFAYWTEDTYWDMTGNPLPEGFRYASDTNDKWLTKKEIGGLING